MKHLHIPLARYTSTTRPRRRVVWQVMICLGFVWIFTLFFASTMWFTRGTLFHSAPSNTSYAVQFNIHKNNQALIVKSLKGIPLVSNRSVTIEDLLPYIHGEFTVFFQADGSRSVGMRTNIDELPLSLFDALHLSLQNTTKHSILLSETLVSTKKINVHRSWQDFFSFLGLRIGFVYLGNESLSRLFFHENELHLSITPKHSLSKKILSTPEQTIAYLSTELLDGKDLDLFSSLFGPTINIFFESRLRSYIQTLFFHPGTLFLTIDDQGLGFLLTSTDMTAEAWEIFQTSVRLLSSLSDIQIRERHLKDQTLMKEIISDPNLVVVEHLSRLGRQVQRAPFQPDGFLFLSRDENQIFLSNREELLFFEAKQPYTDVSDNLFCDGTALGLDIHTILHKDHFTSPYNQMDILRIFSENFSKVGIEVKKYSTDFVFCN